LGNEFNAIKKDPATTEVFMALAFPDIYEVGMSHLGLKILYHILNGSHWLAAERVFSPWVDLEKELRDRALPLTTLESGRPLSDFDIVGFSLQHELSFTNVLTMLELSGIPFLSRERENAFPLIVAGGPACFNPEPVASLFDAIVLGDGEEAALEICQKVREAKLKKVKRKEDILSELTTIKGVYIPSFFKIHYREDGIIRGIEPLIKGYKEVEKAIVPDIDQYPFPGPQVVPFTGLIHDRLAIEISRGCTRGCRFCQAGMIYRPLRERNPESVMKDVEGALRFTGFDELSLLSLSSGDYCAIGQLLKELMDRQSRDKIAISLPSLRVDSLDPAWFEQIKRVRKTGFTLAPEAGNDRLRRVINKPLTNREILHMARNVYEAGWNLIKLYFMVGLPTEDDKDLQDIIHLAKEVSHLAKGHRKKAKLNVSVSTFVPKPHTPFMWMSQIPFEESKRRIKRIRDGLKDSRVRVKWNQPELSWLEGIFSRGDRRLTRVLIDAWRLGARFDAWGEHFKMEIWKEAFKRSGSDPEFYLYRSKSKDEVLPWDHIKSGVTKGYLKKEWKRALEEKITPDCREKCFECGVCDHETIDPIFYKDWAPSPEMERSYSNHEPAIIKKYRITFSKTDNAKYLGHLELVRLFIRAFKRSGLNLVYSKGYHPMPKVSFTSALPVGTESIHETVDINLYGVPPVSATKEAINRQLVAGIRVTCVEDITLEEKSPGLRESHYHITMNGLEIERTDLEKFIQSDYFPITRSGKKREQTVNARSMVKSMSLVPPDCLSLVITHSSGPMLKPIDVIKGVFHLNDQNVQGIKILKTKQVMG
jgi:radical SAM family uncharacterized protein/radical SAM-linked protein